MIRIALRLLAVLFFAACVYFYLQEQGDRSLVAFVFGVAALFLDYRFTIKSRMAARAANEEANE
ncbi:MAG TPA: hypothetical protein PKA82_05905 [Pyrinomonadaceae bacterium]|nr:hypothetical protein [Pyrinomonadaceae bacterium]